VFFAFAAYNAGRGVCASCDVRPRPAAWIRTSGSTTWSRIASERIGRETVTYVSNIYKYYVTYLLIQGEYIQRQSIKKAR
jgi:soluble lytic murein transglycosylase-like protein